MNDADTFARAAYERYYRDSSLPRATIPPWDRLHENGKDLWREIAADVIDLMVNSENGGQ